MVRRELEPVIAFGALNTREVARVAVATGRSSVQDRVAVGVEAVVYDLGGGHLAPCRSRMPVALQQEHRRASVIACTTPVRRSISAFQRATASARLRPSIR